MTECIFCKMMNGDVPYVKIWEDDGHVAIMDAFPDREGQVLVITKEHFGSHVFDLPRVEYKNFLLAAKKAAKFLERGLRADRILMVSEGLDIDHAHIKLYPYFENAPKTLGVIGGERKTEEELQEVAKKIKENNK